ncbi:MAG: hypothetical protein IKE92_00910 [Clostridiales bacterium]|nr:hypothetical protein [Clostridiales bacterium]
MKRSILKITATLLIASMAMSVAACSSNGGGSHSLSNNNKTGGSRSESRSGDKISSDDPWFDSNLLKVDIPVDGSRPLEYTYPRLAGVDDKYIVILTSGYYKMPTGNDVDWNNFNYNDYAINVLSVLDRNSKDIVNSIDLTKDLPKNGYIDSASYTDGKITTRCTTYDDATYSMSTTETDIDPISGNVLDKRDLGNDEEDNSSIERTFKVGEYKIDTSINWDNNDNAYYVLYITDPNGDRDKVKLKETGVNIYDIPLILSVGNDKAIIPARTENDTKYYELDLKNGSVDPANEKEYNWLDFDSIYNSFTAPDGTIYFTTSIGISKIDLKNKRTEEIFNYSWCGVNRSIISYLELVECSDDGFVLAGENYAYNPYQNSSVSDFIIVEFNKASKNPHAGKKILEMYSAYGSVNEEIGDAIIQFNENSKDYFIEVTDRYSNDSDYDYSNINSEDDWENLSNKINAEMSNALAMDIMNGEGPDILLNTSDLGQLNNTNYLVDLSPYIGNLDSGKYFTNVLEEAKVDGNLYQFPVCFTIEGIHTDAKYAGASGVGFTTKEYEKFLNETLNGTDVIPAGQAIYFTKLFNNMSEKFIVDGKADFSSAEFEQLAEYVKDNVQLNSKSWDEMYNYDDAVTEVSYGVGTTVFKGDYSYSEDKAVFCTTYGISNYFSNMVQYQGTNTILGIPSTDGRGPRIAPYFSIAVSAQAENVDACGEFVKLLLSDDVQKSLALSDNFVLSREAFREAGKVAVEYYNGEGGDYMVAYDPKTGMPVDNSRLTFSEKNIDDMEKIIDSCSGMNSSDASINLILIEEMQPYFLGQKDLKNVATVAQDRVQKVLDERG